jgi:RimJ/RimL family protein N-acetyltransferase
VTLAPAWQRMGLTTEALGAMVARLFDRHGIHRVYAQADDRNVPVQRVLERLGFRCEARLLEAVWFKGEWATLRTNGILRREWRAVP